MEIIMAGLEASRVPVEVRETYALTHLDIVYFYNKIKEDSRIKGVLLLSTCNRVECYLSVEKGQEIDPFSVLYGVGGRQLEGIVNYRKGEEAALHLFALASGIESKIWGDSQIITQIKTSLDLARHHKVLDNQLEVLGRLAITCGKRVRSDLCLNLRKRSIIGEGANYLYHKKQQGRVLVIGNGEIGQGIAEVLAAKGYETKITLRAYKYATNKIPKEVTPVPYQERYEELSKVDMVVSATSSPHYTLKYQEINRNLPLPKIWLDLAVPRDIDPKIGEIPEASLCNIDMITDSVGVQKEDQREKVMFICKEYYEEYLRWKNYRKKEERTRQEYFPLFISSKEKVLVIGGGKIGTRRIKTLLKFQFDITLLSPEVTPELENMIEEGQINYLQGKYETDRGEEKQDFYCHKILSSYDMILAATKDKEVNKEIGKKGKELGKWYNVADERENCKFYFPGVVIKDNTVLGVVSGGNPKETKKILEQLEKGIT